MDQTQQLQQAIAAQETLRGAVPDAIIDATIAMLQEQLDSLQTAVPEQQRKQVTVLFADVAGFTAMSETLDAELVSGIMNEVWRKLDAVILAHNGRIDKHIGDALMALWGSDTAREDDAEQAIRAALAMQAALADFAATSPHPIAMRIGLNTGPVLLGQVGATHEFTAMGSTVNLASRLEAAAAKGSILISHATYSQVRGVFDVHELEPVTVKGKQEPLRVYEVERAKPRAFRMSTRGVEGVQTRMIGRDAELGMLEEAYLDAIEGSETRVVTVIGEAGVGKSRLLYEFDNWLELRPELVTFFKGRSAPTLQSVPHALFRDLFATRFNIRDNDSTSVALDKFRAGFMVDESLTADQADIVGHWLGFDFSSSTAVANLLGGEFAAIARTYFTRYFRALTAGGPVTLFLEDIHWADDASLDLVIHLAQALPAARLLIVTMSRRALYERRPLWGNGESSFRRVDLQPLSRRAGRALVDEILQLVADIPPRLRDTIVETADGNPFYTEELVKMFIDQGVIVSADPATSDTSRAERWAVVESKLAGATVPPTLTGLLQARLDHLPRPESALLQRAAVVGRQFWDGVVADLSQTLVSEVQPLLEHIRDRELIFQREISDFAGCDEYVFKHNLLRDVAYERVLLKERQVLHGRVARWLEEHAGERLSEYLSLIAGHYEQAGANEQAAAYLLRAGREAREASSLAAARAAAERVRALDPHGQTAVEAGILLGDIYRLLGDPASAHAVTASALEEARRLGDKRLLAEALTISGRVLSFGGPNPLSITRAAEGLALARELGGRTLADAVYTSGMVLWVQGEIARTAPLAEEALLLARHLGDTTLELKALNLRAIVTSDLGDLVLALQQFEETLAFARATGNLEREAVALLNLGDAHYMLGDYAATRQYAIAALQKDRELGLGRSEITALSNLAQANLLLGDLPAARRDARQALRLARERSLAGKACLATFISAEIMAAQDERPRALATLVLVHEHPSTEAHNLLEIDRILERLAATPAEMEAARATAAEMDLDAVMAEILAEDGPAPAPW